jgi:hypothetical protein
MYGSHLKPMMHLDCLIRNSQGTALRSADYLARLVRIVRDATVVERGVCTMKIKGEIEKPSDSVIVIYIYCVKRLFFFVSFGCTIQT